MVDHVFLMRVEKDRYRIESWRHSYSPVTINLRGQELDIRFSAGLATAPQHGLIPDELINAADAALYHAKAEALDQLRVFQPVETDQNAGSPYGRDWCTCLFVGHCIPRPKMLSYRITGVPELAGKLQQSWRSTGAPP